MTLQHLTRRDRLSILTYNVQGLSSRKRRLRARAFLEGLHTKPDIICLQEHKLRSGRTARLLFEVWHNSHFIIAPASDGVNALRNDQVMAGRGL